MEEFFVIILLGTGQAFCAIAEAISAPDLVFLDAGTI
jgi:hypothetical protein